MEIVLVFIGLWIITWLFFKLGKNSQRHEIVIRTEFSGTSNTDNEKSVYYQEKDNWEKFNFYGAQMLPAKGEYHISYNDQKGLTTERDITIKRAYDDSGKFAVDAFCHLRGAHRSFIDERIKHAVEIETGEIVKSVAQHAIAQYGETSEGKVWKAIGREMIALYLLAYVCRADGRMLKAERVIIADYLKRNCKDIELDDAELDKAIKTLGAPDYREFKRIVKKMTSLEELERLRDIADCAKRIVHTQKTIDPLEQTALDTFDNAMNEISKLMSQ